MDDQAATELKLYIDNDADLHRQQHVSILKNLATKKARGEYKHDLAVKLFGYLVEAGAKKYAKAFGTPGQPWHKLFDVPSRKVAAQALTRDFEAEFKLGNYDHLLPKKYQPQEKSSSSHHARKKVVWRTPEGLKIAWSPVRQVWFALWPGRGRIEDQQVLKAANTDEMDAWLRETYGDAYGRGGARAHHSRKKGSLDLHRELHEPGALRSATDRQLQGFYRDEKRDVAKARAEATRRGLPLHARKKKSPSELDREIAERVPSWRGGR